MCPEFVQEECTKWNSNWEYYSDGICRPKGSNPPSKIVCPEGFILCPNLTCRYNYDECELSSELPSNKVRCIDQSIVSYQDECPSVKICNNPDYVACASGQCVKNEIYCPKLKTCSDRKPYLCANNGCAKNSETCTKNKVCGQGGSLCQDNICREYC